MKQRLHNFFIGGRHFKKEFRKQMRFLIIITLGFTIAFTWRQTIFDSVQEVVRFFTHVQNSVAASVLTSTAITLISILIIYVSAQLLKDNPDHF